MDEAVRALWTARRHQALDAEIGPSVKPSCSESARDRRPTAGLGRGQSRTHVVREGVRAPRRCRSDPGLLRPHPPPPLNRSGDRAANHAHTIVLVRMRFDERTRAYVERRTKEGLSKKDIMRCLKRLIAREVHRALASTPATHITQNDLAPAA